VLGPDFLNLVSYPARQHTPIARQFSSNLLPVSRHARPSHHAVESFGSSLQEPTSIDRTAVQELAMMPKMDNNH
jgi:hypothetical protein